MYIFVKIAYTIFKPIGYNIIDKLWERITVAYSEISKKATNKYRQKFEHLQLRVPLGEKQKIVEHASKRGESLNVFLNRAVKETMERDTADES